MSNLRYNLIKLAYQTPTLRLAVFQLLADEGSPDHWDEFLQLKYEGGKKKVPNTNTTTRDKYPEVAVSTLLKKDEHFRKEVEKEYHEWAGEVKATPKASEVDHDPFETTVSSDALVQEMGKTHKKDFDHLYKSMTGDVDKHLAELHQQLAEDRSNPDSDPYRSELALHEFEQLTPQEKTILAGSHRIGTYYQSMLAHQKPEMHQMAESYTGSWVSSSASPKSQRLHGLLASMGVRGSPSPKEKNHVPTQDQREEGAEDPKLKSMVEHQHAFTQAFFKHVGVSHLTCYRGLAAEEPTPSDSLVKLPSRELSSWTADPRVSLGFIANNPKGIVVKSKIPVQRILLSPITSPTMGGTNSMTSFMNENEFAVMGGSDLNMRVMKSKQDWVSPTHLKSTEPAKNKKYHPHVQEVVDKHRLTDDDVTEVKNFKGDKPGRGKKLPDAELLSRFMAKAKPETRKRMKDVTPAEFRKMYAAIMAETEEEPKTASAEKIITLPQATEEDEDWLATFRKNQKKQLAEDQKKQLADKK